MPTPYDINTLDGYALSEIVPTMDRDLIEQALSEVNIREFDDFKDSGYEDWRTFLSHLGEGVMEEHIQKLNQAASEAATKTAKKQGKKPGALLPDDQAEIEQALSNAGSRSRSHTAIQPSDISTAMKTSNDTLTTPITPSITPTKG